MAARRLIAILLVLLAASVVAASLAPDRTGRITDSTTDTQATTTAAAAPEGDSLNAHIDASPDERQTVEAAVGDQLSLSVASVPARTIAIEPLGVAEYAGPASPAHFDLLLRQAGVIPITDAESGAVVGRLVVSEPGRSHPPSQDDRHGPGLPGREDRMPDPIA